MSNQVEHAKELLKSIANDLDLENTPEDVIDDDLLRRTQILSYLSHNIKMTEITECLNKIANSLESIKKDIETISGYGINQRQN